MVLLAESQTVSISWRVDTTRTVGTGQPSGLSRDRRSTKSIALAEMLWFTRSETIPFRMGLSWPARRGYNRCPAVICIVAAGTEQVYGSPTRRSSLMKPSHVIFHHRLIHDAVCGAYHCTFSLLHQSIPSYASPCCCDGRYQCGGWAELWWCICKLQVAASRFRLGKIWGGLHSEITVDIKLWKGSRRSLACDEKSLSLKGCWMRIGFLRYGRRKTGREKGNEGLGSRNPNFVMP